jgi:urate oxidase
VLAWNRYGKSCVRLVKLRRSRDPHDIVDLTIDVQLEGGFDAVYADGNNASCHATDTMKNTVYAFARQDDLAHVEPFALRLAGHFLGKPPVSRVRISAIEHRWDRLSVGGRPHPHAFVQPGGEQWTAVITRDHERADVVAGLTNLVVLKTTDSSFAGFPRDEFTTLPETADRILATSVTATWRYATPSADFSARQRIRTALVETFAAHDSRSVQHTLYAMGEAALAASGEVAEITLALPNRHHLLVDLKPFGLDNPNEIFVATEQPFGLIEATIRRSPA